LSALFYSILFIYEGNKKLKRIFTMKAVLYISALFLVLFHGSSAFAPVSPQALTSRSSTSLSMGLFDFFLSEEERAAKKAREDREREEQEEMQRLILERRRNPEAMEDYEARVAVRRKLYMSDRQDLAKDFKVMTDSKKKSEE
jgi:hypothetical protein